LFRNCEKIIIYRMKILSACLILLCFSLADAAISPDDIVKLSKAKTKDDVILQLVHKEGLLRPVTSKEIVYLKQQGVSDRVIEYLLKLSADAAPEFQDKDIRSYYTTAKNGKRIRVVTNLDENGKRMGGPVPPDPGPEPEERVFYERPPQEIRVVVENRPAREDRYEEEYPEYVDDRYTMPAFPSYYPYSTPYYPYFPYIPKRHHGKGNHHLKDPNQPHWNFDYGKNLPLVQQPRSQSRRNIPGSKPSGSSRVKP
jgi:hypothetical protein